MIFSTLFLFTSGVSACQEVWAQCGGKEWNGGTDCCEGVCQVQSEWYSQCIPFPGPTIPTPEPTPDPTPAPIPTPEPTASPIDPVTNDGPVKPSLWTTATTGKGTYDASWHTNNWVSDDVGTGHCTFSNVYNSESGEFRLSAFEVDSFVAMGVDNSYDGSKACGMCIEYKSLDEASTLGSGTAMVVDSCEKCAAGDIDFALDGTGRYNMEWKAIDCPVKEEKFQYVFTASSSWYLKLQIRNHKVPIARVELEKDGVYQEMKRGADGHFLAGTNFTPTNLPPPYATPLKLRITSIFGEHVVDTLTVTAEQLTSMNPETPITSESAQFGNSATRRLAARLALSTKQEESG